MTGLENAMTTLKHVFLLMALLSPTKLEPADLGLNRHRMDFRDLGQRGSNLIEPDDSKITSLAVDGVTGRIYGATSGRRAQIFAFEPSTNHLRPLGALPEGSGVRNAVAVGKDGAVYFGTGRDMTAAQPLSQDWGAELGRDHISRKMWSDIEASYKGYGGGRIYRFDPKNWDGARYKANQNAAVEDLGIPAPGEGIYCLELSAGGDKLYGVTYPHGKFFVFDLASRQTSIIGDTWREVIFSGPRRALRSLPADLIVDRRGRCYYASDGGRLAYFEPGSPGKLVETEGRLPGEIYPIHAGSEPFHPYVETWTQGAKNEIYGGTNDGYVFRFDAGTHKVTNLGKPRITRRVRGLALASDGRLYGLAGEDHVVCTLFRYDPQDGAYTHFGPVDVDETPYYAWRPQRFGAMVTGLDGTIYFGEEDRRGHLFFLIPPMREPREPSN
jgi:hypothetical protein